MKSPMKKIGEILVERGYITESQIEFAVSASKKEGILFGEACMRNGFINGAQLAEALATQYGLNMANIEDVTVDEDTLGVLPIELLSKAKAIPVKVKDRRVLAIADPTDIFAIDDIERLAKARGKDLKGVVVIEERSIEKVLDKGFAGEKMLKDASLGFSLDRLKISEDEDEGVLSIEKIAQDASPVVKLVDTTIYDALSKRASDIHLESTNEGLIVKYRLDGVLHKVMGPLERGFQASIISRIKVMSELDISERRIPQDGRFKIRLKNKTIDFRVSIMPSIHGEDAVIRILDKEHITKEFQELRLDLLGFEDRELKIMRRAIREPYGMFLVTGPTGSGKTTTLYAAVSEINTGEDKIVTIEDPVEYELKGVVQIPVNEKKGLTFERGLRSILRHDPDKIMVGEIRDPETAHIAIQAALTGHLVFTTVHANNVFDVIGRFIHMGIEPYNFVSSLNCVLAQRLVRLICEKCKMPLKTKDQNLISLGVSPEIFTQTTFYSGSGCGECYNTGYRGRKAVAELLLLNDDLRDMIAGKASPSAIKKKAKECGMVALRQSAVECAARGETTLEEINRVTFVE